MGLPGNPHGIALLTRLGIASAKPQLIGPAGQARRAAGVGGSRGIPVNW